MSFVTRVASAAIGVVVGATPAATTGCISGDIDEEKKTETIPAGLSPEDSTFRYGTRNKETQRVLVVRLSSLPLCQKTGVPDQHPFVQVELLTDIGAEIVPGTYRLDQTLRARVALMRTSGPDCLGSAATFANYGYITLDEVTNETVRGSFEGTSPDSKLDLRGSFVATRCTTDPRIMCL